MCSEPSRISSAHGSAPSDDETRAWLQRRSDAVSACLNARPTDLPWKFLAELAPMLQQPLLSGLRALPAEIPLRSELRAGIARGTDPSNPLQFVRYLAAAMFHFLPHELPQTPPPSHLVLWIRVPYLKWSLAVPQHFCQVEEADRYARWLEEWLEALAIEFGDGRGLEDVPEYQRPRLRRLVAQHVMQLQGHLQPGDPLPISAAGARLIEPALEALELFLKDEGKKT